MLQGLADRTMQYPFGPKTSQTEILLFPSFQFISVTLANYFNPLMYDSISGPRTLIIARAPQIRLIIIAPKPTSLPIKQRIYNTCTEIVCSNY